MASQECNDTKVDVMHVSTYLPLLLILLRASLYLISMQVLINVVGQMHMIVIVSAWIVYFDAYFFQNNASNHMCGFLLPAALMYCNNRLIAIQFEQGCQQTYPSIISNHILNVLWATSSMLMLAYVFAEIWELRVDLNLAACVSGALGLGMLWTECGVKSFQELWIRVFIFYVFTFGFGVMHACTQHLHHCRYKTIGLHICMHLLFVNMHVLLASMLVSLALGIYVMHKSLQSLVHESNAPSLPNSVDASHKNTQVKVDMPNKSMPNKNMSPCTLSENEALRELMAAKRALNLV